jgi:hypothetical protein
MAKLYHCHFPSGIHNLDFSMQHDYSSLSQLKETKKAKGENHPSFVIHEGKRSIRAASIVVKTRKGMIKPEMVFSMLFNASKYYRSIHSKLVM